MTDPKFTSIKKFPIETHSIDSQEGSVVINEAVARKLGLEPLGDRWHRPNVNDRNCCDDLPDYCHSIEAAWEVVDSLRTRSPRCFFRLDEASGGWLCTIEWREGNINEIPKFVEWLTATAPMAICLAFLKLEDK